MFRKMRHSAKKWFGVTLMFDVAWLTAIAICGAAGLIIAVVNGDGETVLALIRPMFVAITLLAFGYWMTRNARKTTQDLRRQRRQTNTRRPSDINPAFEQPPWMC